MNFRSVNDLDSLIRSNLSIIPDDVELIVGIPRSGMLPATLLSVYLNLPLTDSMSLLSSDSHGTSTRDYRLKNSKNSTNIHDYNKVLVIDDSCNTGLSINEVKQAIETIPGCDTEIIYACVFASPDAVQFVDLFFEIVPQPRVFEWNIMNHDIIRRSCFDIDGVLCIDPTDEQNDDGEKYIGFLQTAKPLWIPKFEIGALVTSRLEKYRPYTEKWLEDHGVKYQNLIMLNLATKEERIRMGAHAVFKANIYSQITDAELFIESDPGQAAYIAEATGKPVYCVGDNSFHDEASGVDRYLDKKRELEEYVSQIRDVVRKLEYLRVRINESEGDPEGISGVLMENWEAIITDITTVLNVEGLSELRLKSDKARVLSKNEDVSGLKALLGGFPKLCEDTLTYAVQRKMMEEGEHVSDVSWNRELRLIQEILKKGIIESDSFDNRYEKEVLYIKSTGCLQMYPYKWTEDYKEEDIKVYNHESGMKYVLHNSRKLFLLPYDDEFAKREYNQLIMEQDPHSPHRYFDDLCDFREGDIFVDVGAAEGIISLDVVEMAKEIYLIECSQEWIRSLKQTFADYMDKVHIVQKYVGATDSYDSITLDTLLTDYKNERIFIKMDIEGMELEALRSGISVFRNNRCNASVAVYHNQSQEREVIEFFEQIGYNSYPSDGYILFLYGKMALLNGKYERVSYPYFRRGVVRAIPT